MVRVPRVPRDSTLRPGTGLEEVKPKKVDQKDILLEETSSVLASIDAGQIGGKRVRPSSARRERRADCASLTASCAICVARRSASGVSEVSAAVSARAASVAARAHSSS